MTAFAFITGLALFVAGAGFAYLATWRILVVRYDLHTYHQVALDAFQLRAIEETAAECVHEARVEAKGWVGDLLDTVADLRHENEVLAVQQPVQVETVRRYQLDYGTHR